MGRVNSQSLGGSMFMRSVLALLFLVRARAGTHSVVLVVPVDTDAVYSVCSSILPCGWGSSNVYCTLTAPYFVTSPSSFGGSSMDVPWLSVLCGVSLYTVMLCLLMLTLVLVYANGLATSLWVYG